MWSTWKEIYYGRGLNNEFIGGYMKHRYWEIEFECDDSWSIS